MVFEKTTLLRYEELTKKNGLSYIKTNCPQSHGIYFYVIRNKTVSYPFGPNRIIYIGKATNLRRRIGHHFSIDMKEKLLNSNTLQWSYQNYFLPKSNTEIDLMLLEDKNYSQLELLFIGQFFINYGAPPLCNGSVQRKKLPKIFGLLNKTDPGLIKEADKLISTLGNTFEIAADKKPITKKDMLTFLDLIEEKHTKAKKEQKSYRALGDGDATIWKFIGREEGYDEILHYIKEDLSLKETIFAEDIKVLSDYLEQQTNKLSTEAQVSDSGSELQFCLAKAESFRDTKSVLRHIFKK